MKHEKTLSFVLSQNGSVAGPEVRCSIFVARGTCRGRFVVLFCGAMAGGLHFSKGKFPSLLAMCFACRSVLSIRVRPHGCAL